MHHSGVTVNIRQPNVKSTPSKLQCELCKSAQVRSPDELAHVTWSFNGSQMFTTQEPTQRNISTYHISQSKMIIFRDSSYILRENSILIDLKAHSRWTVKHWKRTLAPASLLPLCFCGLRRIVKSSLLREEGMNLGRGNDNCSGPHTLSGLIRSFAFKWRHLQSWLITPYSGVNPQTTLLFSFQTEAQTEGNSLWLISGTGTTGLNPVWAPYSVAHLLSKCKQVTTLWGAQNAYFQRGSEVLGYGRAGPNNLGF